jgi:hypothetical protein
MFRRWRRGSSNCLRRSSPWRATRRVKGTKLSASKRRSTTCGDNSKFRVKLKTNLSTHLVLATRNQNSHRTQVHESVLCSAVSGVQSFLYGVEQRKGCNWHTSDFFSFVIRRIPLMKDRWRRWGEFDLRGCQKVIAVFIELAGFLSLPTLGILFSFVPRLGQILCW